MFLTLFYSIPSTREDRRFFVDLFIAYFSLLIIREARRGKNYRPFENFFLPSMLLLHGDNLLHFNSFCLLITQLFLLRLPLRAESVNASNIYKSCEFFGGNFDKEFKMHRRLQKLFYGLLKFYLAMLKRFTWTWRITINMTSQENYS